MLFSCYDMNTLGLDFTLQSALLTENLAFSYVD